MSTLSIVIGSITLVVALITSLLLYLKASKWEVFSGITTTLLLCEIVLVVIEGMFLGFPDGSLTDYDRAIALLHPWFLGVGSVLSVAALYVLIMRKVVARSLLTVAILVLLASVVYVRHFLWVTLDHGIGG